MSGRRTDPPLPQAEEKTQAVRAMFDTIAPRYDLVNRLMTFGLDVRWRRRTVRALGLPPGSLVADVACGTGDLCRELRRQGMVPVGVDLSAGMLAAGDPATPMAQADASALPLGRAAVDAVTSGFALRNFTDLAAVLAEIGRVVRPGGRVALLDAAPTSGVLQLGHRLWFEQAVPRIGGALSDRQAYRYLPRSLAYLPPAPELVGMVRAAGFSGVNHRVLSGGVVQLITGTRRGPHTTPDPDALADRLAGHGEPSPAAPRGGGSHR